MLSTGFAGLSPTWPRMVFVPDPGSNRLEPMVQGNRVNGQTPLAYGVHPFASQRDPAGAASRSEPGRAAGACTNLTIPQQLRPDRVQAPNVQRILISRRRGGRGACRDAAEIRAAATKVLLLFRVL